MPCGRNRKSVGFLGCGLIGGSMAAWVLERPEYSVSFVQDPFYKTENPAFPVVAEQDKTLLEKTDLVVEAATADILKENATGILLHCDLMPFSVTAFADKEFADYVERLCKESGRQVFFPHGAILGLDGIFDGRNLWENVGIETVKSPQSLGRKDTERTLVYEGTTRDICKEYPRNVNVHAMVALAGIGFDKTVSRIISDPGVTTNAHTIRVEGDGISFAISVSSASNGGITGRYTPFSACGSLARVLETNRSFVFV